MRHPNLSPELNDLFERGEDSDLSLNLRAVKPGDVIMIVFGNDQRKNTAIMFVKVAKPAGSGLGKDSLAGALLDSIFPKEWLLEFARKDIEIPPLGIECVITGSCTKNPGAPLGLTMLHFHTITVGRNLLWYLGRDGLAWLFWDTVSAKSIIQESDVSLLKTYAREHLGLIELSPEECAEVTKKAQLANRESDEWRKYIKQPLRVKTRNSVYILGQETNDGSRTIQKQPDSEIMKGKLLSLRENARMSFLFEDGTGIDTSTVLEIDPI